MGVEEQVKEGNRVASRWILNGTYHGRTVCTPGHHDHSSRRARQNSRRPGHSDSIALLGHLGVIRALILGLEILTRRVKLPQGAITGSRVR
jgi:hypothetical protein